MAKGLSKSRYTQFRLCDKALWLSVFKPEAAVITDAQQAIFDTGSEVGDLAMGLLGDFEEMTTVDPNGQLDKGAMIEKTKDAMARGVVNICEAAFSFEGNYCAVDILHKTDAGYEIYEVKSSTSPDKEIYGWDVAYQKYVLTGCGLNVTGTYLVSINNQYVLQGDLDLQQLFKITDISKAVDKEIGLVDGNVKVARNVLAGGEPDTPLSMGCHKPYDCQFWEYCTRELPKPSVFDVKGLHFDKKIALHNAGRDTFESIQDYKLNKIQRMQVECTLKGTASIDKAKIQAFLDPFTDRFPLYYLDFESIQPAIPIFDGTHPYQQLTTQFSLHIQETPRGKVTHKEFLAPSKGNPLRPVAEALIKKGFYYLPAMGGRSSIKSVLPALFPNDPQLDYHALDDICQNGGDAKSLFPKLQNMSTEDEAKARRALLDYCCLDTLAMVKVMDKLYEAVEE